MAEFLTDDEINKLLGIEDESQEEKEKVFLDQYEINELMGIDNDKYYKEFDNLDKSLENNYAIYDFTKPNRLSSYILENLNLIQTNIENSLYSKFEDLFQNEDNISSYSIDQISFSDLKEFSIENIYAYEYRFNNDSIFIETSPKISKQIIKYLTGKGNLKSESSKAPTKLELSVFEVFQEFLVQELQKEFNSILTTKISDGKFISNFKTIDSYEDKTQMLQISFTLTIDEEEGFINIIFSLKVLLPYIEIFKNKDKDEVKLEFKVTNDERYQVVSLMLKNKDIVEGNEFDLSYLSDEVFSQIDMPKLDFSSDNEIRNNISLKTKTIFKEAENSKMNFDFVDLEHPIDEDLEVWINDQLIGYGKYILIGGHNGFKFTNFNGAKEDVINNIKNRFNIIKNDDMMYLTQDNRVLFELEQNQDTEMYSLKRV